MKKTYIKPSIDETKVRLNTLLSGSPTTGYTVYDDSDQANTDEEGLAKGSFNVWGDEEEDNGGESLW